MLSQSTHYETHKKESNFNSYGPSNTEGLVHTTLPRMVKVESQQNVRKERQKEINTYLPNRRRLFRVTPPTVRQNDCASFEDRLRGLRVLSPYRWRVISNPLTPTVWFAAESRTTQHRYVNAFISSLSLTRAKLWSNPQKLYTRGHVSRISRTSGQNYGQ